MPPKNNERRKELQQHALAMLKTDNFDIDKITEEIENHIELGYFVEILHVELVHELRMGLPSRENSRLDGRTGELYRLVTNLIQTIRWLFPAVWMTCEDQIEVCYIANNFINRVELMIGMKINARGYKPEEENDESDT